MSISAKLSDIRTAISSAYTAVSNMGGTVPALPTLNALPSAIQTIPTGGGDIEQYQKVLDRTVVSFSDSTLTSVGSHAFYACSSLTTISLPVCSYIGAYAFYSCSSLTTVSLPACSYVAYSAFYACSSLTTISLPVCSYIGENAFVTCWSLSTVSLPVCSYVDSSAFGWCRNLTAVSLPVCSYIGNFAFEGCSKLASVSLPVCSYIGGNAFAHCTVLSIIYIGSSKCTLSNISVFSYTGIWSNKGYIFVKSEYYNTYKTSTNWTYFKNRIFSY